MSPILSEFILFFSSKMNTPKETDDNAEGLADNKVNNIINLTFK